jgi:hypothetical protein
MSQIGIPGLANQLRRTVRSPVNPMDRSTIVSIYPRVINERKPTITPSQFVIPAGTFENPSILVVGSSSWWREVDQDQPLLEIPNSSIQVAESVVRDYCNGLLGCNMTDAIPGIFWIPGEYTVKSLKEKHPVLLQTARTKQNNYYDALIRMADGLWARTNGNPLVLSDDMRLAARERNQLNKDWMKDFTMMDQVRCPACGNLGNPNYPICANCKAIINKDKAKELGIEFAKV